MKINNFKKLAVTETRRFALEIANAGLEAIDTAAVVEKWVRLNGDELRIGEEVFDLKEIGRLIVSGVGKCALEAAHSIEGILGDRIHGGVILYIAGEPRLQKLEAMRGTHPLPSEENMRGTAAIVGTLKDLKGNDLVIFIVSGGGSTLLCLPEDMGCREEASILGALTKIGATIQEINTVRKHLSLARGGYIAKHAYPARVVSLIFSDVPGDDIQFISSGPTVKDKTTIEDAESILSKYDVLNTCGIEKCGLIETPKEDKYFERVKNIIVVSNMIALRGMEAKAMLLGLNPVLRTACLTGEAREEGKKIVGELHGVPSGTVLLYGGETTVTIRGRGRGGRNLEFVTAVLGEIQDNELIMAVASDGRDNGEFAGAICDKITKEEIKKQGIDWEAMLQDNNEYPLFEDVGHYLLTGDTGSNIADLFIALRE